MIFINKQKFINFIHFWFRFVQVKTNSYYTNNRSPSSYTSATSSTSLYHSNSTQQANNIPGSTQVDYSQSLYENAISQYSQQIYNYNNGYNMWTGTNTIAKQQSNDTSEKNSDKLTNNNGYNSSNGYSSGTAEGSLNYQFASEFNGTATPVVGLNQFQQQHMQGIFDYPNYLSSLQVSSGPGSNSTNNTILSWVIFYWIDILVIFILGMEV